MQANSIPKNISISSLSFIHFGYFYSASSSPLLLRDIHVYSIDTVLELTRRSGRGNYMSEGITQGDKVPTWWLEWDSNLRPSAR